MSKAAQSHELTYDLIKRAVHGDQEAIEAYLLHYDAYINFLVSYDEVGPDGRIYRHIDEDMKIEVQMKLVDALQNKWRKLKFETIKPIRASISKAFSWEIWRAIGFLSSWM